MFSKGTKCFPSPDIQPLCSRVPVEVSCRCVVVDVFRNVANQSAHVVSLPERQTKTIITSINKIIFIAQFSSLIIILWNR